MLSTSESPTPYAVVCQRHGMVYLTHHEYTRQLMLPDATWVCPVCGTRAWFDDENYEERTA